ncbi:MAG: hypothetical protein R3191_04700 [Anaerolineales bacterium]|nr:hypothetical protein [Anaerolineales bacterium]
MKTTITNRQERAFLNVHTALLVGLGLLLTSLACRLSPPATSEPTDKAVATQVAATLTALAPSAVEATSTPESPSEATTAPTPTEAGLEELTVVYIDDGDPWITTASGTPRQLSDAGDGVDVLISDDGQLVVYLRRASGTDTTPPVEIRAVSAAGSDDRTLMSAEDVNGLYPLDGMLRNDVSSIEFIPGTHDLLLNTRAVPEGPGLLKYNDLLRLDAETGELTTLFAPEDGGDFVTSPDGEQLALVRPDSIGIVNSDGSNLRPDAVSYEPVITYSEFQYYAQPIWSSDSSELAVMIPSADPLADSPSGTLWRINTDGSATEAASYAGNFYFAQQGSSSVVAPDFTQVIVPREIDSGLEISLAPFDGGGVTGYDSGDLGWIGWAPDALHFVYSKGGPMQLQLGEVTGGPDPLATGTDLRWTAADTFLYLSGSRGAWTLRLGSLSGSPVNLVAPAGDFIPYDFAAP